MTERLTEDDSDIADDDDIKDDDIPDIIRAKWLMDGAVTLPEAATRLREFADELDRLHSAGWELRQPVEDDYGYLVPPSAS